MFVYPGHQLMWLNYPLFSVKGQTVTPQVRPPHGPQQITDGRKDDTAYKGKIHDCSCKEVSYKNTVSRLCYI